MNPVFVDPRAWVEAALTGDGKAPIPPAMLRLVASDASLRRYAGGILWARVALSVMPRVLSALEDVVSNPKTPGAVRLNGVRLAGELAGLLGPRAGAGDAGSLAGFATVTVDAPTELTPEQAAAIGRDAAERLARLETRLLAEASPPGSGPTTAVAEELPPAW